MGEANQKGNRFFNFDLINKTIIYKPKIGTKIEFKLSNRKDKFEKEIQNAINNKQLSISVSFNKNIFSISYDEAALCGFEIDKSERLKEIKEATKNCVSKEEHSLIAKQVYKEFYDRLKQRQLSDKLSNRYLGIDLNPEHVGYSIIDLNKDKTFNIVKSGSFNFKKLMKKSGFSSESEETIFINNKRKHERKEVICELFKLMKHYKVGYFVMEDLNFKSNNKQESKEFNRKTKNIWDRELLSNLINKKCTEGGYQLISVNPVYTSLIGNLSYQVFDPVAASIEIVRRGSVKYESGGFFPIDNVSTTHTTEVVAKRNHIDVGLIRDASWKERYTILTDKRKKFRYRWGEKVGATFSLSLKSYKSKLKHTVYCI
jgi:IS605 OrfB family transposase